MIDATDGETIAPCDVTDGLHVGESLDHRANGDFGFQISEACSESIVNAASKSEISI